MTVNRRARRKTELPPDVEAETHAFLRSVQESVLRCGDITFFSNSFCVAPPTFYGIINPNSDRASLHLKDLIYLMRLTGDLSPLHKLAEIFGGAFVESDEVSPTSSLALRDFDRMAGEVCVQAGSMCEAVLDATSDDILTPQESMVVRRMAHLVRRSTSVLEINLREHPIRQISQNTGQGPAR